MGEEPQFRSSDELLKATSLWPKPAPLVDDLTSSGPKIWMEFVWAYAADAAAMKQEAMTIAREKAERFMGASSAHRCFLYERAAL